MAVTKPAASKAAPKKKTKPVRIVSGRLMKIENTNPVGGADKEYFRVWVRDENGKNKRPFFFTDKELEKLEHRSSQNLADGGKTKAAALKVEEIDFV